jgi:hypothetical protein
MHSAMVGLGVAVGVAVGETSVVVGGDGGVIRVGDGVTVTGAAGWLVMVVAIMMVACCDSEVTELVDREGLTGKQAVKNMNSTIVRLERLGTLAVYHKK